MPVPLIFVWFRHWRLLGGFHYWHLVIGCVTGGLHCRIYPRGKHRGWLLPGGW